MNSSMSVSRASILFGFATTLCLSVANATVVISGDSSPPTDSLGSDALLFPTPVSVGISAAGSLLVDDNNLLTAGPVTIGVQPGGNGTASISGGGTVEATSNNFDNFYVGAQAGSSGNVVVSGTDTKVITKGTDNTAQIGFLGSGEATFEGGAKLSTLQLEVGRFGDGKVTARGDGTEIVASNDDGDFAGFNGEAGFVRFGRAGNTRAEFLLQDGAKLIVRNSAGGGQAGPGIQIARDLDGKGLMVVEDAGTKVEIVDTFPVDPANRAAFGGPFMQVGRNGDGKAIIRHDAEVLLKGEQALVQVGRGVNGSPPGIPKGELHIHDGGKLFVDGGQGAATMNLGQNESGIGEVLVSGNDSLISIQGTEPGQGPFFFDRAALTIGGRGQGNFRIEDDAQVVVDGGTAGGAVNVGLFENSSGHLLVKGAGSKLTVKGDSLSVLNIGAAFPPPMMGGVGTVTLAEGGTVEAGSVQLNSNSTLKGNGNVIGSVLHGDGTLAPGLSAGKLTIAGSYNAIGSVPPSGPVLQPLLAIDIGGPVVEVDHDLLEVLGDAFILDGTAQFNFINGFAPMAGDMFTFFTATYFLGYDDSFNMSSTITGLQPGFAYRVDARTGPNGFLTLVAMSDGVPIAAPAPATLGLMLIGLLGALLIRRQPRRLISA